jgi:hypothetical protein
MTVIDEARGLLELRLTDLNEEARRLERALAEFVRVDKTRHHHHQRQV